MTNKKRAESAANEAMVWTPMPMLQQSSDTLMKSANDGLKETGEVAVEWARFCSEQAGDMLAVGTAWTRCSNVAELMEEEQQHFKSMAERQAEFTRSLSQHVTRAASALLNGTASR